MRKFFGVVMVLVVLAVSGCFHEEEAVKPEVAQAAAVNQLINILDKTSAIFDRETSDSSAIDMIDWMSDDDVNYKANRARSVVREKFSSVSSRLNDFFELTPVSNARNKLSTREKNGGTSGRLAFSEEEINELFEVIFEKPTIDGSDIIYKFKASVACEGYRGASYRDCIDAMNHISMIIRTTSAESGAVILAVSEQEIFELGYSPTIVYLEVDFGALAAGVETLDELYPDFSDGSSSIPETIEGSFRISVELISDYSAKAAFAIPQTINIADDEDDTFKLNIERSSEVFAIMVDNRASKIELSMGLGSLYAMFFNEDENADYELTLGALTGLLLVDNDNADEVILKNIGIGNTPFTLSIDGTVAFELDMKTFSATLNGDNETIALDSDFDLSAGFTNVNGEFGDDVFEFATNIYDESLEGTLSFNAPSGTVLSSYESDAMEDVTKIESGGPLTISGEGYFMFDESIAEGECFVWDDDRFSFGDGFESGDCGSW